MSALEHPKIKEWLDECRTQVTRESYESRIRRFYKWYGQSVDTFLQLDQKEKRHVALKYQNENSYRNPNTVYSVLTGLNSFLQYLDMGIDFKGKRCKPRPDIDSHVFSNGDLSKMFEVGNTKEKALLALSCSLGWEISAILELDHKTLGSLVSRAKEQNEQFIYFNSVRKKTGVQRFGVINPLALEWLDKWLIESVSNQPRVRKEDRKTKNRPLSEVFDMTAEGFNDTLKKLAKEAHIALTGRVHFHRLRGWVMSGLSRAGFNEFQIKYLLGKAIPMSDMTYLQSLKEEIMERYPKAYETALSIRSDASVKAVRTLSSELEEIKAENKRLRESLGSAASKYDEITSKIEALEKSNTELKNFANRHLLRRDTRDLEKRLAMVFAEKGLKIKANNVRALIDFLEDKEKQEN